MILLVSKRRRTLEFSNGRCPQIVRALDDFRNFRWYFIWIFLR
jgi:hypothetical protein